MWYWHLYLKEEALTVFQKSLLSVILFKSRLLKYFFLSLLYSLLQKFLCRLKSFKFSLDLILNYLCSICPFHYCFCHSFCDIWCMISSDCFVFNWIMSPQDFMIFFSETWCDQIFVILKEFFRSVLKCFLIKQFKISIGNNFWLTFCKSSF